MKNLIFCFAFTFISAFIFSHDLAEVIEVIDGDTIDVEFQDGTKDRIRMVGIDCPESLKVNNPDEYEGIADEEYLHDWASHIKAYTRNALLNKKITVRYDSITGRRGYYGRLLAYVIITGINFNKELVCNGYARVYTEASCEMINELLSAQKEAMTKKIGIWSGIVLKMETVRNNFIIATDVHYNAEGNDNQNLNDEYFALKNISDKPLDLSSWILSDAKGKHTFNFPKGFILKPQKSVYVYSGKGRNTERKLYWGSKGAIGAERSHVFAVRQYRTLLVSSILKSPRPQPTQRTCEGVFFDQILLEYGNDFINDSINSQSGSSNSVTGNLRVDLFIRSIPHFLPYEYL